MLKCQHHSEEAWAAMNQCLLEELPAVSPEPGKRTKPNILVPELEKLSASKV